MAEAISGRCWRRPGAADLLNLTQIRSTTKMDTCFLQEVKLEAQQREAVASRQEVATAVDALAATI